MIHPLQNVLEQPIPYTSHYDPIQFNQMQITLKNSHEKKLYVKCDIRHI